MCEQISVQHPAAKSMIEVARTQDEETGDGTKSVIILGQLLPHSWTCVKNGQSLMSDMGFLLSVLSQSVSPATMCLFYVSVWQVALWSVCLQGARCTTSFVWIVPFTLSLVFLYDASHSMSFCVCVCGASLCVSLCPLQSPALPVLTLAHPDCC